jgi:hypothetical protein
MADDDDGDEADEEERPNDGVHVVVLLVLV